MPVLKYEFDSQAMETLKDVVQEDEGRGHTLCKDLSYYWWLDTGEQECFGRQVTAEGVTRWTESEGVCCLQNSKHEESLWMTHAAVTCSRIGDHQKREGISSSW